MADYPEVSDLVGKILTAVEKSDEEILFRLADGSAYKMYHSQDCCETVRVEEVIGDLDDLVGSPILQAEEVSNADAAAPEGAESYTWTFYKLATIKGRVTVRWLGESNGYYGEHVDFAKIESGSSPA